MAVDLDNSVWQKLMNAGYDRWQAHKDWSYSRFLLSCSGKERAAVLFGNLNYQVENGGFSQWIFNGYAQQIRELIDLLRIIGNEQSCKIAIELADKLSELSKHLDLSQANIGCYGDYWLEKPEEDEPHDGEALLDNMDDWYYKDVQPKLLPAIEAWLAKE